MQRCTKKFLAFIITVLMIFNFIDLTGFFTAEAASKTSAAPLYLEKLLPKNARIIDKATMLKLAEKYYKQAINNADSTEKIYIPYVINWKVEFSGENSNPQKAKELSYPNAYLINYTNMKNLYIAVSSSAVSIDFESSAAIGNLASAIITYGEDSFDRKSKDYESNISQFQKDAEALYIYSLFIANSKNQHKSSVITEMLNLGHLYLDMCKVDDSKKLFEEAFDIDKNYLPAREGLAAYYIAKGDKKKAEEILKEGKPVYIAAKMKKVVEDSSDKNAPPVSEGDSIEVIEQKIDKLNEIASLNAAEFFEDLAPNEVKQVTEFIDSIKFEIKYQAPSINMISQYSTLENFKAPMGQAAFEAFVEGMNIKFGETTAINVDRKLNDLENLGLNVEMNFDINEVLKNPEKYENFDGQVNISGIDQLESRMKENLKEIEKSIAQGDGKKALEVVSDFTPRLGVLTLNPRDYSNPTDVLTQIYNLNLLNKKIVAIGHYNNEQRRDIELINNTQLSLGYKLESLKDAMDSELAKIECNHENGNLKGSCDVCTIKAHQIHLQYIPQMNEASETAWKQVTDHMCVRYNKNIKPRAEATYKSAMANVMLISDPDVRLQMETELKNSISLLISTALTNVVAAYSTGNYMNEYDCSCDLQQLEAARERERKAFEKAQYEKTIKTAIAKKEFEAGIIPESSPLYAKLDSYATVFDYYFVEGRISPMRTNVRYKLELPGVPLSVGYEEFHDRNRNTTTRGGGISLSGEKSLGSDAVSVKGTLSLKGEVTTDGKNNITNVDVVGGAEGEATAGILQVKGGYEASVMRGSQYSGEVSVVTDKILQIPEEASTLIQAPRKVLWQGEYSKK